MTPLFSVATTDDNVAETAANAVEINASDRAAHSNIFIS
ncbi:protein of unknown function [Pararobbsia alpina]